MTFWIMECAPLENENGEALLIIDNHLELGDVWSWKSGVRFTPDEASFEVPVRVPFRRVRGYAGPVVDLIDVGAPLMSLRLHEALAAAGVDTLDTYPAQLEARDGAERVPCVVYNITRRAQMNPAQTLKLFRLEENVNAIAVSDAVKKTVEARGIGSVTFTRPSDWVHL